MDWAVVGTKRLARATCADGFTVGGMLALYGQTYQTGANTYELFLVWAFLITPWALIARLPALWVLWLVILHVAYIFYVEVFEKLWGFSPKFEDILFAMIFFDVCVLAVWECLALHGQTFGTLTVA